MDLYFKIYRIKIKVSLSLAVLNRKGKDTAFIALPGSFSCSQPSLGCTREMGSK